MPKRAFPRGANHCATLVIAPALISIDDTTKNGKREGKTPFMHRFMPFTHDFDVSAGNYNNPIPKKTRPVSVTKGFIFSNFKFNLITS